MALTPPDLDDRTFQQIVVEATERIPAYFDGWTDRSPSDPGMTLIELFAWMTEIILYRQNQLPDWLTVKMMQLFGMNLDEATAAQTAVTFQFASLPQAKETIDMGTEVATTQTEMQPAIIFSTDQPLTIHPDNQLKWVILKRQEAENKLTKIEVTHQEDEKQPVPVPIHDTVFSQQPVGGDAIYFGFARDVSHYLLHFHFECHGADGIDTTRPPYVWEGATHDVNGEVKWTAVTLGPNEDETLGLFVPGRMIVHLAALSQLTLEELDNDPLYWVRLRVRHENEYPDAQTRPFTQSPRVVQLEISSMGGTVMASHAEIVKREFLGYSDGTPGQRFWLQASPILRPEPEKGETLCVQLNNQANGRAADEQIWYWAKNFSDDVPIPNATKPVKHTDRKIFTLDTGSGEIRLPPAQTDAQGNVQRYGTIPPRGAALWFNQYRHGGGKAGNVPAYALNTLKTAIPNVDLVYNRQAATGGQDQEPLDIAKLRAPALLHAQNRAVTAADYEYLAARAGVPLGRVKCLQPEPGWVESVDPGTVYLFVLPNVQNTAQQLRRNMLAMPAADRQKIQAYLDERRLLTTRLHVANPEIIWVQVHLTCKVHPGTDRKQLEQEIRERLYRHLNPLNNDDEPEQTGWPFGQDLYTYDVYSYLQGIPNLLAVPEITLYRPLPEGRERLHQNRLPVPPHAVLALDNCFIKIEMA